LFCKKKKRGNKRTEKGVVGKREVLRRGGEGGLKKGHTAKKSQCFEGPQCNKKEGAEGKGVLRGAGSPGKEKGHVNGGEKKKSFLKRGKKFNKKKHATRKRRTEKKTSNKAWKKGRNFFRGKTGCFFEGQEKKPEVRKRSMPEKGTKLVKKRKAQALKFWGGEKKRKGFSRGNENGEGEY